MCLWCPHKKDNIFVHFLVLFSRDPTLTQDNAACLSREHLAISTSIEQKCGPLINIFYSPDDFSRSQQNHSVILRRQFSFSCHFKKMISLSPMIWYCTSSFGFCIKSCTLCKMRFGFESSMSPVWSHVRLCTAHVPTPVTIHFSNKVYTLFGICSEKGKFTKKKSTDTSKKYFYIVTLQQCISAWCGAS